MMAKSTLMKRWTSCRAYLCKGGHPTVRPIPPIQSAPAGETRLVAYTTGYDYPEKIPPATRLAILLFILGQAELALMQILLLWRLATQ